MANIVKIDEYTGNWQKAINPKPAIGLGYLVETPYAPEPDAREWDDLRRHLASEGLALVWSSCDEDRKIDTYVVVAS